MKSNATKRFVSAILALIFLVAAFVLLFDAIQPAYGNLMTLKGQLAAQENLLQSESSTIDKVQSIASAYAGQTDAAQAIDAALPDRQDIAGAVAQLYGLAQTNSVSMQNLSITVSAPPAALLNRTSSSAANIMIHPTGTIAFSITASGNYES